MLLNEKAMKKILISLCVSCVIYLLIALVLIFLPIKRIYPEESLDFSVLKNTDTSNVPVKESTFTARDNSDLFYRSIEGDKDITFVLLHGSGAEGQYLISLAAKLNVALNITVVIPDLRGHGESSLANMGDVSYLGQFEHDLEDLYNHLVLKYSNPKMILGGHSSGGGLALKYGGNGLLQFDAYILLAPYLGYKAPTVRPNSGGWVQVAKRRYAGLAMLNNITVTMFNDLPVLFFNRPKNIENPLHADYYSYRLNESYSPQDYIVDLQNNKKPILLLVGQNDEAFYSDKFATIFNEYAKQTETTVISGLKHLDLVSDQITAELIIAWIDKTFIHINNNQ